MEDTVYGPPSAPPAAGRPVERRRRGPLFWIAMLAAGFFFVCTIGLFVLLIFMSTAKVWVPDIETGITSSGKYSEVTVEGSGTHKIVIIPVEGIITDRSLRKLLYNVPSLVRSVTDQLDRAASDDMVEAVILEINSPGGGITATDTLHDEILQFKEKTGKKVVVYMKDVAASGGYYIAACSDRIVAHPTSITGSIGVIMMLFNFEGLYNLIGVSENVIKSGKLKDMGSSSRPITEEEKKLFQEIIMEMHSRFVDIVSKGRGMPKEEVANLADGRVYTGQQALGNGLIDAIGYIDDVIEAVKEESGLDEAKIIRYRRKIGLSELILTFARGGGTPSAFIDVDALTEKQVPKLMYLWTPSSGRDR